MDQEAINVASAALPDEHLNEAPANSAVVKSDAPQATPESTDKPAESVPAKDAEAGDKEPQNTDAQPQEPAKKPGIQKRIDELTRERYEAQRAADYWKQQAEAKAQAAQQPVPQAPRIEDYQDVNQFMDARDAYVREQTKAEFYRESQLVAQRNNFEAQQHQTQVAQQQVVEQFLGQEAEARNRYADYDQAVSSPLMAQLREARPDVIQAVIDSQHGPDLAYFLAKNPQRAQQIASLNRIAAAREIGRIEQMFMGQQPQATKASEPVRTIGGKAEATRTPENMSFSEYRKWRSKK